MTYLDLFSQNTEAATNNVLSKKVFLEISQNSQKNTCARVPTVSHACNCIKKETLAQLFSCEFCEVSKAWLPRGSGSSSNFIAQNLLVGTLKVRHLKFVTQNER